MVAQGNVQRLVLLGNGVELLRGVDLLFVVEAEGHDLVEDVGTPLVGVGYAGTEGYATEVAGTVDPVSGNLVVGGGLRATVEVIAQAEEEKARVGEVDRGAPFEGVH